MANGLARFIRRRICYSLFGREVERDMMPMRSISGKASPGGSAGLWLPQGRIHAGLLSKPDIRFFRFLRDAIDKGRGFALRGIAGVPLLQLAIIRPLARRQVTSVLLGATKLHEQDDNPAGAAETRDEADLATRDAAIPRGHAISQSVTGGWIVKRALG